jgi:hypothetical protein
MTPNPNALTALAMLKANWDQDGTSYLESVFPFISAVFSKIDGDSAEANQIAEGLDHEFGLRLPFPIVENLLNRGCVNGIYRKDGMPSERRFSIVSSDEGAKVWARRSKILRQQDALLSKFIKFATQEHGEILSEREAEERLLRQVERASVPVLKNWLKGEPLTDDPEVSADIDYTTSSFILHLLRSDTGGFSDLEAIVQGNMLASALYYAPKSRNPADHFKKVYVILDTRILFRALGYEGTAEKKVVSDILRLAFELDAQIVCLKRTIQEMRGVMTAVEKSLTPGKRIPNEGGPVRTHFLSEGATPSDIRLKSANLESDLRAMSIRVIDQPPHSVPLTVDEQRLEEVLNERVHYRNNDAMLHDLAVLTAVYRYRSGESQSSLEDCKAIFITPNDQVVRACRTYFQARADSAWPLALADHVFATVLWLKRPQNAPELPRNKLIANAYAGLVPSIQLWNKFLSELDKLAEQDGDIEKNYTRLRYDLDTERLLVVRTKGDASRVKKGTVYDILDDIREADRQAVRTKDGPAVRDDISDDEVLPTARESSAGSAQESHELATQVQLETIHARLEHIARRIANFTVVLAGGLTLTSLWFSVHPPFDVVPKGFGVLIRLLAMFGACTGLAGIVFGFTVSGGMKAGRDRLKGWLLKKLLGRTLGEGHSS